MRPELKRLQALKEPESEYKGTELGGSVNRVEFFQDKERVLAERVRKLENETNVLKSNVAVLGRLAKLMWVMTMIMVKDLDQDVEVLGENVATLGAVAQGMIDMILLMGKDQS
jgi:hypothetical protein